LHTRRDVVLTQFRDEDWTNHGTRRRVRLSRLGGCLLSVALNEGIRPLFHQLPKGLGGRSGLATVRSPFPSPAAPSPISRIRPAVR